MPNRAHVYPFTSPTAVPESAINTETVVGTLGPITSEMPNCQVAISGTLQLTAGTSATAMTVRIRRDSLTGVLVPNAEVDAGDVVAGKLSSIPIDVVDTPAGQFSGVYVVTIQGTAETVIGTSNGFALIATVC